MTTPALPVHVGTPIGNSPRYRYIRTCGPSAPKVYEGWDPVEPQALSAVELDALEQQVTYFESIAKAEVAIRRREIKYARKAARATWVALS